MTQWATDLREWVRQYEQYEAIAEGLRQKEQMMGRYTSDAGNTDFKQAPPGTHIARCYNIVDIGTHHDDYQGEPTVRNQIIVRWELPNETELIDGQQKPLIVSKFYTNSLSEKANLRRDLESWRARPFAIEELMKFDLAAILGKPCMVTIIHNEKGKAKVVGVSSLPKGTVCPPQFNSSQAFWIDEWDDQKFQALPDGFRKLIEQSDEFQSLRAASKQASEDMQSTQVADDIPF